MPSAISPCDLDSTPTTIWMVDSTRLTPTLTQVLRDAAAARSDMLWPESAESAESGETGLGDMKRQERRA